MKILIADDHALMREGVHLVLTRMDANAEIFQAQNHAEALRIAAQHPDLDLVLVDLVMPGLGGFEGIRRLREQLPDTPLVVLSASESPADMRGTLDVGARGYIPKSSSNQVMLIALELVLSGGVYMPPEMLSGTDTAVNSNAGSADPALTRRQREVLGLLAEGKTNKEIGRELGLTEGTVRTHLATIFRLLNVSNRTQAGRRAAELGLVPLPQQS